MSYILAISCHFPLIQLFTFYGWIVSNLNHRRCSQYKKRCGPIYLHICVAYNGITNMVILYNIWQVMAVNKSYHFKNIKKKNKLQCKEVGFKNCTNASWHAFQLSIVTFCWFNCSLFKCMNHFKPQEVHTFKNKYQPNI